MDDDQIRSKQKQIRGINWHCAMLIPSGSPYVFAFVFKLIINFIILKTMKLIKNIFQHILLPIIIAGVFFAWSQPRITTDYNFNTDELIYLERSKYATAYFSGDFTNPIWSDWGGYDQPQLTNYLYSLVPGDRQLISPELSPCPESDNGSFYKTWDCLAGPPLSTWPDSLTPLRNMVVSARTLATTVSSFVLATTYYLGLLVAGPVAGTLAAIILGTFTFFKSLSTMAMMDQLLLLLLNLQLILTLLIAKKKNNNLPLMLALGAVTGLAFSTKFSAAIPTALIYTYLTLSSLGMKKPNLLHLALSTLTAAGLFYVLHPNLWLSPVTELVHMLSWRASQLEMQTNTSILTHGLLDQLTYTYQEIFKNPTILALTTLGALTLFFASPVFTSLTLLNVLIFIAIIPVKWNRYLLPVLPTLSIYFASLPFVIPQLIRLIKNDATNIKQFLTGALTASLFLSIIFFLPTGSYLTSLILILTIFLTAQGYLVTRAMLHGFSTRQNQSIPRHKPEHSFSLILPARDEADVIGHTIKSLANLNYPKDKYEVLVMIRADDYNTINAANQAIDQNNTNIRVIPIDGDANNKAYSLNLALHLASHDVIGIFDAEDEPSREILSKVNDYLLTHKDSAAVQAPVHLTNLTSSWYATLSAVEYYYWFASVLPYLSTKQIVPLGGNTIFIKKEVYKKVGVYDEACLTEDADLGIRLAAHNIKIGILTDPALATREEVPTSEIEVVRQRARWDQGYLQVLDKSYWQYLKPKQKIYALYTLSQPLFRHLSFLNMVFAPLLASLGAIPITLALTSIIPGYFLLLQLGLYLLGVNALSRLHNVKVGLWQYVVTLLAFVPYQALLTLGTLRALSRLFAGNFSWDKTSHTNAHRSLGILE